MVLMQLLGLRGIEGLLLCSKIKCVEPGNLTKESKEVKVPSLYIVAHGFLGLRLIGVTWHTLHGSKLTPKVRSSIKATKQYGSVKCYYKKIL